MRTAVHTSFWVSGVVCAVMMILGLTLSRLLLALIDTPMRLMADSVLYLDIYVMGLPFVFFYNIANGIFSALGDSRTPFLFLAASSLSNIGMDILFVKVFGMKVDGVAWATFLCQGVSCVLAIIFVFHRLHSIKSEEKSRLFSFHLFRQFCRIAIPSTLQQSFISVGNIIIQGVINGFGTEVIAGYSAAIKMNNLVITSFNTVSNGISNYTGQNLGAGMVQRVRSGFAAGLKMMGGIGVAFGLIYWFTADWLVRLFMEDPSAGALQSGVSFLHIVAPFYVIVAAKLVADGVLRGAELYGTVYGFHLYRSFVACGIGNPAFRSPWKQRNLERMAGWLDHCRSDGSDILFPWQVADQHEHECLTGIYQDVVRCAIYVKCKRI